jgi:hypothetical protein
MSTRKRCSFLLWACCAALVSSDAGAFLPVQRVSFSVAPNHRYDYSQAKCEEDEAEDTIRVRIWRALASGDELSLSQLGRAVGERRLSELRSHLQHVERQAKTLRNKSDEWKVRRGLIPSSDIKRGRKSEDTELPNADTQSSGNGASPFASKAKVQLKTRKGKKNEVFVRLA